MDEVRFWWVRHAPVVGNDGRCYGVNDVDCDVSEKNKFIKLAKLLPKNSFVYSSHLLRTIKTLRATENQGFSYLTYEINKNFAEQDLGLYAGLKYEDLDIKTKELGVYHSSWLCALDHKPPKGESYNTLYLRVVKGIKNIIKNKSNSDFVIFSHGGPIRAAISYALTNLPETSMPFLIDNISLTRIDFIDDMWQIKFVNFMPS